MNGLTERRQQDKTNPDLLGQALQDYLSGAKNEELIVYSDLTDPDEIPVSHFFRSWDDMPEIERRAIRLCRGKTMDVGAAAGCHSLELQKIGMQVKAIDVSGGAVDVMKSRGVKHVERADFFTMKGKFDTLLLLMNGIGICGSIGRLEDFFKQCKDLLNSGGQVLLDSSDILYMYEDDDGSTAIDLTAGYYGEVEYRFGYKGRLGGSFKWLFVDFGLLSDVAEDHGFKCELVAQGPHFDYLSRLTKK